MHALIASALVKTDSLFSARDRQAVQYTIGWRFEDKPSLYWQSQRSR